jgi:hypothetical protein
MKDRTTRHLERQREATFELDTQRLTLERDKLELEKRKLAIEDRNFVIENRKIAVNLYIEDFKARWQKLLNLESVRLMRGC